MLQDVDSPRPSSKRPLSGGNRWSSSAILRVLCPSALNERAPSTFNAENAENAEARRESPAEERARQLSSFRLFLHGLPAPSPPQRVNQLVHLIRERLHLRLR